VRKLGATRGGVKLKLPETKEALLVVGNDLLGINGVQFRDSISGHKMDTLDDIYLLFVDNTTPILYISTTEEELKKC